MPVKLAGYQPLVPKGYKAPGTMGPTPAMGSSTMAAPLSANPTAQNPSYVPAQPAPLDPTFEAQLGLNQRTFNDANVGYDQQQSAAIRSYGLDDPSDPFSKAALLAQMFHNRQQGATNSYAARGQLYSGAIQNAQNAVTQGYQQDYDALRKGQNDVLARIAQNRGAAKGALEQGNIDAAQGAVDRAAATPVDPSTVPAVTAAVAANRKKQKKNLRLV